MDETIAKWIIEFLLRRKIDDNIVNSVISILPIPNQDYRLKKTMILRRIETEIANGCVSEKILELIEIIEGLDHENSKTVSDLMKEAYCLVAVDCTVRFLGETVEENKKYLEMVETLWKNRVCKSEGLVSELSKKWLEDIELAWKDSSVCEKIWMRNTRNEALRAVKAYLKEAWECLGPSFLELVAAKAGKELEGLRCGNVGGSGDDNVMPSGNPVRELVSLDGSQKGQGVIRRKHVASKRRRPRGPKISDADDEDMNKADDSIPEIARPQDETPEVEKVKEVMSSSPKKTPATDKDHHSDNLQNDQNLSSSGPTGDENIVEAELVGGNIPEITRAQDETAEVHKVNEVLSSSPEKPPSVGKDHNSVDVQNDQTSPFTGSTSKENVVEDVQVRNKIIESRETTRIRRVLRSSTRELRATVSDPLPEALEKAQTLVSSLSRKTPVRNGVQNAETSETMVLNTENDVGPSKQAGDEIDASKGLNEELENGNEATRNEEARGHITLAFGVEKNPRKRSLMEPNDTSHNYQWDDEIENSSASPPRRKLPSPKAQKISPLKIPGYRNGRRERKRWTPLEEQTLREGVLKYGRGNWKSILLDPKCAEVFQGRTEVDLKDKWRNLTRYLNPPL